MREEVRRVEGGGEAGLCRVQDNEGNLLGVGTYNPKSRFPVRMLSLEDERIDEAFFAKRFSQCVDFRNRVIEGTNSCRLVFSEADRLPGLIVDQYGPHLVVQVRSMVMEMLKPIWLPALIEESGAESIIEKSEMAGREEEGLEPYVAQLFGETPDRVEVEETDLLFESLIQDGLKTGFYLDQRNSRRMLGALVQPGDKVLDCFCYTGAFSLYAAREGAHVTGVDIHTVAIEQAKKHAKDNDLKAEFIEANAFDYLSAGADGHGKYDWIILDPPAIAKTYSKRDSLKWAVWKLVHAAIPLLKPGGRLLVCSCSYQLSQQLLLDQSRLASSDHGKGLVLEEVTFQDLDHPAPLWFPEALYLKSAWLRVED
jgi:23S rRNA (cytosine1962-C5)-methyltransferase